MSAKAKIGVLGASGYTGAELVRLLLRHPHVEVALLTADRRAGKPMADVFPQFAPFDLPPLTALADVDWAALRLDLVFCALPHGTTQEVISDLLKHVPSMKVVDLSADFRIADPAAYERWYGEHPRPDLMSEAVYGLTELHRERIAGAAIVANPGCYPTASLLALAPLARAGLIADVVIDAKQGISGAGRVFDETTHLSMAGENIVPYKVAAHRHTPEIEEQLARLDPAHRELKVQFQAHLVPLDQGELASCYVTTTRAVGADELREMYREAYEEEPFVELLADAPSGVLEVRETNYCRVFAAADEHTGKVIAFGAIDNLWKGTSSQAVQNLNLMFGLPETAGLQ